MKTIKVILRRSNGRFVRERVVNSKYAAKKLREAWEEKYDDSYYVEVKGE